MQGANYKSVSTLPLTNINYHVDSFHQGVGKISRKLAIQCIGFAFSNILWRIMESFCERVMAEIMSAASEVEFRATINNSLITCKANRGSDEVMYVINMIVSLQSAVSAKDVSDKFLYNFKLAVEMFRMYHMNYDRQL